MSDIRNYCHLEVRDDGCWGEVSAGHGQAFHGQGGKHVPVVCPPASLHEGKPQGHNSASVPALDDVDLQM